LKYVSDDNIEVTNTSNSTWEPKINEDQRWWISHEFRNITGHENW